MNASELWAQGDVAGTIAALTAALKAKPADTRLRSFLFEALAFDGSLERAAKHLELLATQAAPADLPAFLQYRGLLAAEEARRAVFNGTAPPKLFGVPPAWLEPFITLPALAARDRDAAVQVCQGAREAAPVLRGVMNGQPFASLRDLDARTSCVLELYQDGEYAWLPFADILRIEIGAPQRLRDLLWAPAEVETRSGRSAAVFVPVLYAGSHLDADDAVRLGRTTVSEGESLVLASGQRLFQVDDQEVPFLSVRVIEFEE